MCFVKALLLILLFCLFHSSYSLQSQIRSINTDIKEKIDNFIENKFLPYSGVKGLALTVVKNDGELLYTTGYGYADHEKMIPNGNATQFLLGSVTKSFTALVVVKALHEHFPELGEAVLDTPIKQLLPQSNFTLHDRIRSEHATFRDLLSHKMCISREDFQLMTEPFDTTAEILYRQRYAEESCGFRSRFMYNNHMVLFASELIGHLHNQTFQDFGKRLLDDIGMVDSKFVKSSDDFSIMPFRAKPYYLFNNMSQPMNPELLKRLVNVPAIGGLYVTPNDMARFLRFQLNLGKIDGHQIIPEEVMTWLTKPSSLYPKFNFKLKSDDIMESPLAYGLGLMIGSYDGWQRISHNGYFTPYRTEISWYPALNIGIFTSTHETPTKVQQQVLHAFIFETLLGKESAGKRASKLMSEQRTKVENDENKTNKILDKFLGQLKNDIMENRTDDIIGKYKNSVAGDVEIFKNYNQQSKRLQLYLKYGKWAKGWIENIGGITYQIIWETDLIQDYYAAGDENGLGFVNIRKNGLLEFVRPTPYGMIIYAQFKKEA